MGSTGRPPPPVYTPQRVARKIVATLDRPRRQVHAGFANPLIVAGFRLAARPCTTRWSARCCGSAGSRDRLGPTAGNVFESQPEQNATRGRWRGL